jgi:Protein of unknown function (DUF4012)
MERGTPPRSIPSALMTEPHSDDVSTQTHDPFAGPAWDEAASAPTAGTGRRAAGGGGSRRVRVRVSRRKRRRRRQIRMVVRIIGGAIAVAAAWIVVTGLMARSQLNQARAAVEQLRAQIAAGDLNGARVTAAALGRRAHRARELTTGPAWATAAALPVGGDPLQVIRGVTASVDAVGRNALPQLVTATQRLDPATLRHADGSIELAAIANAAPALEAATQTFTAANSSITALPKHTWLPSIDAARADVLSQMSSLGHAVTSADLAVRILPPMLGADGPKRYFVAFQNDAEARGTGGLPGAFAIAQAEGGRLRFVRFESDAALAGVSADVDFGAAYKQLYDGAATTTLYGNGNLSPHFPYAARIWSSMWQKASGERVDGVVAVDPTALSYLLSVTGPVTLPDNTRLSATNVVSLTQSTVYAKFPRAIADLPARRKYLLKIAKAASTKVLGAHVDTTALVQAAGKAADERRLLVWSADSAAEALIQQTSVSGAIPVTPAPYVGLSIVNDGGNKLDYYLDRTLTWQRSGCGATRQVTVRITLTNHAPASGLPKYVTYRSDRHGYPAKPGDNRLEVSYLATTGAVMRSVSVDGRAATAGVGAEQGHPLYTVDLELPRGTSRTIVLHLVEPAGTGSPIVLRQPLVRPLTVTLDEARCD